MDSADIAQLRTLLVQKRFADALRQGEALLVAQPGQRDALLGVAVALRCLGRPADALVRLETLECHQPQFSRLFEERGRCHVDLRDAPKAIAAFEQATAINHSLPLSWRMLEGLYRMTGRGDDAARATAQLAILQQAPPQVITAAGMLADRDLDAAEALVRSFLLQQGNQVDAMRLLAAIGVERKVYDDAEVLLAAVLQMEPDNHMARREYAGVLAKLNRHAEARRLLEPLLQEEPGNRDYRALYAFTCVGVGEHERAVALYSDLLQGTPADADMHLSIAHAQKTLGHRDAAIESYRRAAACRPEFGDAYWSLANLKTYRFTDEELARMRGAEAAPATGNVDRYHLRFALGKAFEDRGDFAESFRHYAVGNTLKRAESRYRPEIIEANTRRQVETCTPEFFARRRGWGAPAPDPIFIVGLPRSGSTLIEQILASHSRIEGTQELATIQQIVVRLRGREPDLEDSRYPRVLEDLTADDCRQLGELYLQATREYRGERPFFIDKMPNNFRHIGLIHLILPNARIIDARREPMACCFSNFKQLFASGQEFTYSMEDIARYYRTYLELMRHWQQVLPGRVLRVQHEDLVDDLAGNVRRILDFVGVEFQPQCLEFHKTERSVRTASSEQVRQPIYREGLDHWRNYHPWLAPLREALGDALERYRDE